MRMEKQNAEITNATASTEEGEKKKKKTTSEQEMNLPHSAWLECTPPPRAVIIL